MFSTIYIFYKTQNSNSLIDLKYIIENLPFDVIYMFVYVINILFSYRTKHLVLITT